MEGIYKIGGGSLFYLELQNNTNKGIGFKPLDETALIKRFDATPTVRGYKSFAHLVETDKLAESELFNELLGFMNTDKDKQHSIPLK